jgi:hypothetical protein
MSDCELHENSLAGGNIFPGKEMEIFTPAQATSRQVFMRPRLRENGAAI